MGVKNKWGRNYQWKSLVIRRKALVDAITDIYLSKSDTLSGCFDKRISVSEFKAKSNKRGFE